MRPAIRMAFAAGHAATGIPVITSPDLTFGGRALSLQPSGLKVAEIPLGLVILLRELGRGILNLHNAIEYKKPHEIRCFAQTCSQLSFLLYQPAPLVFTLSEKLFKRTSLLSKLYASQITHILGVFVILHEFGHICKSHNLDPFSEAESKGQEHEADIFAMECQFAPKIGNAKFAPFRKLQMIAVCNLLTLMDLEFQAFGAPLYGYPSFQERRLKLLRHFEGTDSLTNAVINSINRFEREVRSSPPLIIPQSQLDLTLHR